MAEARGKDAAPVPAITAHESAPTAPPPPPPTHQVMETTPLSEAAAVEAAVSAHRKNSHQNMFASFSVTAKGEQGTLPTNSAPLLHWGNVDTGAMVNLVYQGVVEAFPVLQRYRHAFHHVVSGVGQTQTRVVGKLVGVPVHLGPTQIKGQHVFATFYVLDCPAYHWILGLPLLTSVDGVVHCRRQVLQYSLHTSTTPLTLELALTPRAAVQH